MVQVEQDKRLFVECLGEKFASRVDEQLEADPAGATYGITASTRSELDFPLAITSTITNYCPLRGLALKPAVDGSDSNLSSIWRGQRNTRGVFRRAGSDSAPP